MSQMSSSYLHLAKQAVSVLASMSETYIVHVLNSACQTWIPAIVELHVIFDSNLLMVAHVPDSVLVSLSFISYLQF